MDFRRIGLGEILAAIGALLLGISLVVKWYEGTILISTGGALRASDTEPPRRPPGVL